MLGTEDRQTDDRQTSHCAKGSNDSTVGQKRDCDELTWTKFTFLL